MSTATAQDYRVGQEVRLIGNSYGRGVSQEGDILTIIDDISTRADAMICIIQRTGTLHQVAFRDVEHIKPDEQYKRNRDTSDEKVNKFYQACSTGLVANKKAIEKKRTETYACITDTLNKLKGYHSTIRDLETLYKSAKARAGNESVLRDVRSRARTLVHWYDAIDALSGNVYATTKHIEFTHPKHKVLVKFGVYSVQIDLQAKSVKVEAIEATQHRHTYIHPNVIAADGHICMGTYSNAIQEALAKRDVALVLYHMYDLLSNTDDRGAYTSNMHWAVDAKDRCTNCWDLADECTCSDDDDNRCSHCGAHVEDCTCLICPVNGEPLQDNCFPDSYCMECRRIEITEGDGTKTAYCPELDIDADITD